jgi:hypothetical protein
VKHGSLMQCRWVIACFFQTCSSERHKLLNGVNTVVPAIFYTCTLFGQKSVQQTARNIYFVVASCTIATLYLHMTFNPHFAHYCPFSIKFGIRKLCIMLPNICEFRKTWWRKGRIYFTAVNATAPIPSNQAI